MPVETLDTKVRKYADMILDALHPGPTGSEAGTRNHSPHKQVAVEGVVGKILVTENGAIAPALKEIVDILGDAQNRMDSVADRVGRQFS